MAPKTVAIAGLGLMGGSLAAACRRRFPGMRILGVSRSRRALADAKRRRWIHEGFTDIPAAFRRADLIVICTPVDVIPKMLRLAEKNAKPGTLVTDVGSIQSQTLAAARRMKLRRIKFVPAHPMVGSHDRGLEAARLDLYAKGFGFVIRPAGVSKAAFSAVLNFWRRILKKVVPFEAGAHDRVVAAVSHLPHAAATALVMALGPRDLKFVSTGFLDTTRVAQGDVSVWLPIFMGNRAAITQALRRYEGRLKKFRSILEHGKAPELRRWLEKAARIRREISL